MPIKIRLREDNLVNGFMTMMARHLDEDASSRRGFQNIHLRYKYSKGRV